MIDINKKIPGCKNFYWREVLFLNGIDACVYIDSTVEKNLIDVCKKLQLIRNMYGKPIKITSGFRPPKYNKHIGGAARSFHTKGGAIDFKIKGVSADRVRKDLVPKLKELGLRMEDLPKSNWVHIDIKSVGNKRFFKP